MDQKILYFIFFGVEEREKHKRVELLSHLCADGASELEKRYKEEIDAFFKVTLITLDKEDTYRLFEMMNGFIYRAKAVYDPYQSERLNTNFKFHVRMAVIINFAIWSTVIASCSALLNFKTIHPWYIYALCMGVFYLLGRYWASMFDMEGKGYEAVITDFATSVIIERKAKEQH